MLDLEAAIRSPREDMVGIDYTEQLIQDENGHSLGSELEFDEVNDDASD